MQMDYVKKASIATKAIFLVCGLGMSSWAPMVPYAKDRLQLNDASLGILLLFLGAGAITMMPLSGVLSNKYGSRVVMLGSTIIMAAVLPLLIIVDHVVWMSITLFVFGAAVGAVDVAMNSHGVQVQNKYGKPIMSSLHGLFSVGGLLGSLGLGFLIKMGLSPLAAAIGIAALLLIIVSWKYSSLFDYNTEKSVINEFSTTDDKVISNGFTWLKSSVLFLGAMCFAIFLSEGAMLDWSAVFLRENRQIDEELAGIGYAAFSIAMATMRLLGDKLVARLNGKTVVVGGSLVAASGILLMITTPWLITSLLGFVLLGLGAANIVPVFFSAAGRLKDVSAAVAVPAMSTIGYAGQLAGPALLGFIAHQFSLSVAFGFCGLLLILVALSYGFKKV
ncbi:MAG: MFS transporter [Pedobacter sp.]|nr:MAG: MFS transporter [Pedobacter sp.]